MPAASTAAPNVKGMPNAPSGPLRPKTTNNKYPVTTGGSTSGTIKSALNAVRPRKRPRARSQPSPMAIGAPRSATQTPT